MNHRTTAKQHLKDNIPVVIRIRGRSYVCRTMKEYDQAMLMKKQQTGNSAMEGATI